MRAVSPMNTGKHIMTATICIPMNPLPGSIACAYPRRLLNAPACQAPDLNHTHTHEKVILLKQSLFQGGKDFCDGWKAPRKRTRKAAV
jgi:hypothetical protein